jgi:hypothetical protein
MARYAQQELARTWNERKETVNYTVEHMRANGLPMLLSTYLELAYMGDVGSLDEVGEEDRAEIDDLLADGTLRLETAGARSIQ